jgi:hypothetical protein
MKPQVCSNNQLCAFKYEELGLGVELHAEILKSPQLVDLLISFFSSAVSAESRGRVGLFFPANVKSYQKDGSTRSFVLPPHSRNEDFHTEPSPVKKLCVYVCFCLHTIKFKKKVYVLTSLDHVVVE